MVRRRSPPESKLHARNHLNFVTSMARAIASDRSSEADFDTVRMAALIALAARGVMPARLKSTLAGELLQGFSETLFNNATLNLDETEFADCLTKWLNGSWVKQWSRFETAFQDRFLGLMKAPSARSIILDPLLVGWIYQSALMERTDYSLMRERKSLHGLAQITQWFTPDWISEFLVERCFRSNGRIPGSLTFLDSSCGAGHILLKALGRLLERRVGKEDKQSALSSVLEYELFGIDIDPAMVSLSGFSIYLACLDSIGVAPLPIPQLFALDQVYSGSLILSPASRPDGEIATRIDGTTISLNELPAKFDIQALNPPYLSHRLMPEQLRAFLRKNYKGSQYDLYTAFLELGIRLMAPGGRLALICQQSFLTTNRYEQLRKNLLERVGIECIVQLGPGVFASRAGEKVNNAIIVLHRRDEGTGNDHGEIEAFRLFSRDAKERAEKTGIENYKKVSLTERQFLSSTASITGFPIVPFCPEEIAALFTRLKSITDIDGITLTNGLFTCDNKRFVRHFSEVEGNERQSYVPYDKGGGQKWYSTTPYLLKWEHKGAEIREFRNERGQARALPGERFYFQQGITYSYIGTRGFKARLLSPGSVFDIASSAVFSEEIDLNYVLGFLNSALVRFILGTLNPTVNFQIGDLRRIPFALPDKETVNRVSELASEAIELGREVDRMNISSPAYTGFGTTTHGQIEDSYRCFIDRIETINQRERHIQNLIDELIFDLYSVSPGVRAGVLQDEWVVNGHDRLISAPDLKTFKRQIAKRITETD